MDYTQLAADELIDRAYSARDEFNTLFESNDISDSTLDRMATLVDELESLQTEADSRVTFAILSEKREELARKVKKKLFLPGGLRAPSTPPALPGRGPGSPAGPVNPGGGYGVGFAEEAKQKDDDSEKNAGVSLAEGDTPKDDGDGGSEDLSGLPVPKLLGMLRTEEKGSPKYKAAKAALAEGMKKKSTVKAQLDTPYKGDLTPARAKDIKVTKAVEPENAETVAVEKKAASSPPTLALNPNVAPIEHMPTKEFPVGDVKHPGAKVIKSGTVKGLKVPREQGQVTYSEEDPISFADSATKSEGAAGDFPASDYAYVPDATESSTWKLRLTATPGGGPDPHIVGAAAAALSPGGFRGQKVQIPAEHLPAVKAKVASAWKKANSDKKPDEMPDSLK